MSSQTNERQVLSSVPTGVLIAGSWREARDGATFPVDDPATGETLIDVADATPEDGLDALAAAADAQSSWAATPPRERAEILRRAFEELTRRVEEFALLVTLEMGKPLAESRGEVAYAADFLRWFSEEACRVEGSFRIAPAGDTRILTMRQPVGPCLFITPWNFPIAMAARKIGPAIAAGCTMVLKPASQTPLTSLAFAKLLTDCGLPDGVLNVVATTRAGDVTGPLLRDRRLRKLSFTGSTEVGRTLMRESSHRLLRLSMELGGNAPFLVFADADLDAAVNGAMLAKMRNGGEACTAANRFLVDESVAEEFATLLATRMSGLRLGRGTEEGVELGPLITAKAREGVAEMVADAVDRGAQVRCGGHAVDGPGWFYEPTVLTGVAPDARVLREEVFGPVAPITTFAEEAEAIAQANATEYGLVAYVYTESLRRGMRVAEALEFGMVGLNSGLVSNPAAPFGGVKESGFGREGGREGIEEYLEIKYVATPASRIPGPRSG